LVTVHGFISVVTSASFSQNSSHVLTGWWVTLHVSRGERLGDATGLHAAVPVCDLQEVARAEAARHGEGQGSP